MLTEAKVKEIDFITIDVEGHEISVLEGFSIDQWQPKIVLLEDSTDLEETEVSRFMKKHNYRRFYRTGGNDWYASHSQTSLRNFWKLIFSKEWETKGVMKAWLPANIRRSIILTVKFLKGTK